MAARTRDDGGTERPVGAAQKAAWAAGFEDWPAGGGLVVFRRDGDGRHWLVADGRGGIEGDPKSAEWTVACHSDDDADEDGRFMWTKVSERVTLARALDLHSRMPEPRQAEQTVARWDDLGMGTATVAKPRR